MESSLSELLIHIKDAIKQNISDKKIGIAFSGGVDSTLVAKIVSELGYDLTLLTIGFPDSHDILFSKEVNDILNQNHKILEINPSEFNNIATKINQKIKTENLSWNENCIAFYHVSKLAQSLGIKTVVTANGIDELFCGYNAYREVISEGEQKIAEVMNSKLDNELKMMKAVNDIASEFDVRILQPLLSQDFIEFAKAIPISEKIIDKNDLLRKHIIRNLAVAIGVPKLSATKRKKALQYGSRIHKSLIKFRKTL